MGEAREGKRSVIVFCAHSDDQILGVGGTIAKYAREGIGVAVIVFSFGEKSHPWLQRRYSAAQRVRESQRAGRIVGCREVMFLGFREGNFRKDLEERNFSRRIQHIIRARQPSKIFVHSEDDPHPDHRAVSRIVLEVLDSMGWECDVYSYDVWNPFNLTESRFPRMFVDITDTFRLKFKALGTFKSQRTLAVFLFALFVPLLRSYISAFLHGLASDCRWAERFYKIR